MSLSSYQGPDMIFAIAAFGFGLGFGFGFAFGFAFLVFFSFCLVFSFGLVAGLNLSDFGLLMMVQ